MKRINKSILVSTTILLFFGCKHQPLVTPDNNSTTTTPTDTTKIVKDTTTTGVLTGVPCSKDTSYFTDVLPIFISYCASAGCHNASSKRSGYELDSYANILSKGIKAGSSSGSTVYNSMTNGSMPQGSTMSSDKIAAIKQWIDEGAKNNTCKH